MDMNLPNERNRALVERSKRVVPNGIWGHMATRFIGPEYPQFFSRADGCRVWDIDGNEYIDFMCSWGPNILGYRHPDVERVALDQLKRVDSGNGPTETMVELAELLVDTLDHADWAMFQKNGTDATTLTATIARAATGKRKLLVAKGAYHGAVPWCSPSLVGVTAEDRAHILQFEYNDIASLDDAAAQAGDDLAGIMLTAFRHDMARDQEMPNRDFLKRAREICDRTEAALLLDDVRAGFRLDIRGSWAKFGVRPDLASYSKAIANGWPLAAVAGNDKFREGAANVFVTGSFWYGAVSMAAAITTIKLLKSTDAIAHTHEMGQRLRNGLEEASRSHGFKLRQTGPASMPMVLFDGDQELQVGRAFCHAMLRRGVYLHPRHNMFLCSAHKASDIDRAVDAAHQVFAQLAKAGIGVAA